MYGSIVGKLAPETTASWKPQLSVTDFGAIHEFGLREARRLTRSRPYMSLRWAHSRIYCAYVPTDSSDEP